MVLVILADFCTIICINGDKCFNIVIRLLTMAKFTKRQWLTLIVIGIADFCNAICVSLQAPFYPAEAEKKGCTATEYGLVFGIFKLVVFIVSPLYGQQLNKIGLKVVFNGGIYTTGICVIIFGFLDKVEGRYPFIISSFIIRIMEAMGNAAFWTASSAIIAKEFPDKVATIFACLETFSGLGLIVGPTVGGVLYQVGGYTVPFAVMGTALFASAILTSIVLPKHEIGINQTKGPSVIKLLKIPGVLLANASIFVTSTSISFLFATLEPHLRVFHLTPVFLGLMFVISGGVYALTTPALGWLCDSMRVPKLLTIAGTVLIAAGFCLIGPAPFIPLPTMFWLTVAGLALHGLGVGAQLVASFADALKTAILHGCPDGLETYGQVSGLWVSSFAMGGFIGPSIAGVLYDIVGFRNASMFVVVINLLLGIAIVIFLVVAKLPPGYVELEEDSKLPNSDVGNSESIRSIRSNASGISIEQSRPSAMNSLIACNSYKGQIWHSLSLSLGPYSQSYGADNSRDGTILYLECVP